MSRKSLLVGAAAALVSAAATGWQSATFNLGSIMDRFANRQRIGEPDNYSGHGRRHPQTVAQNKRAAIKSKNRAKHRAHMKGRS
ncbi:MAG: hypothetical protein NUV51_01355 [Sulfuricaulis sp.]|nr:hypothetical protein [Sulfuricaulis sp.]